MDQDEDAAGSGTRSSTLYCRSVASQILAVKDRAPSRFWPLHMRKSRCICRITIDGKEKGSESKVAAATDHVDRIRHVHARRQGTREVCRT